MIKTHSSGQRQAQNIQALAGLVLLGLFVSMLAFLGGSSRPDAVQIAALRPLAGLFLIPVLYWITREQLAEVKPVVMLLGAALLWMALQLVPLPPALWQSLPDREIIARLENLTGLEDTWRPISMVPSRGYNALASLIVPISALGLILATRMRSKDLYLVIAALGVVDALFGIGQVALGGRGPLYLYAITNEGAPVGIFANENHSAVFSAVALLAIVRLGLDSGLRSRMAGVGIATAAAFLVVLLAVIISGSRAGFGAALIALAASAVMLYFSLGTREKRLGSRRPSGPAAAFVKKHPKALLAGVLTIVAMLVALLAISDRTPGLQTAFSANTFEDLRWQLWPTLERMIGIHWFVGTGFGSFEEVYHIYERTELLQPIYINQAHNDWAQLVIEGGLPAMVMLGWFAFWIFRAIRSLVAQGDDAWAKVVFWLAILVIVALGSVVDYPLRTPTFQVVAVWLLAALVFELTRTREG